jgi:hypothetical protein
MSKNKKEGVVQDGLKALLEREIRNPKLLQYGEGENLLKINVNPILSFEKRTEMVRKIADMILSSEAKSVSEYYPEQKRLAERFALLTYFTDLEIPKDLETLWLVLNHTPIYDDVVIYVGKYFYDILKDAEALVESRKSYLEHKPGLSTFLDKISGVLDSLGKQLSTEDVGGLADMLKNLSKAPLDGIIGAAQKAKNGKDAK